MTPTGKEALKNLLGQIPFTAELYWLFRQGGQPLQTRFTLKHLQAAMPDLVAQANEYREKTQPGKKVFIFATLHYWIEHAALLSIALAAQGHKVTLGFLPYSDWQLPINRFDLRRQNVYATRVLKQASPLIDVFPFLNVRVPFRPLPDDLAELVRQVTVYDTQYTLQSEDADPESEIYRLRLERNTAAAAVASQWLKAGKPDVVVVPNGTIQELGVVYRIAHKMKIRTVTYEFGDQRQRIWLAQNTEVMRQETDGLWKARQNTPLTEAQMEKLRNLFVSRQRGTLVENFARQWQGTPAQGGEQARKALGLDNRPVVLLATNVLGDSLTLGRQVFSKDMAEWITRTVMYFTGRPDVQLVVRVHPGEVLTHGTSMVEVVREALPKLPDHVRVIGPKEKINTYDIMEVADLGLVYTTTAGMEMALMGIPVIVSGQTHYRGRGFTHDPESWVSYFKLLGQVLAKPEDYRLNREQVEKAWAYAYRFFFEFPQPFPWHLVRTWEDLKNRPLSQVLSPEGLEQYGDTFRFLTGEPMEWKTIA